MYVLILKVHRSPKNCIKRKLPQLQFYFIFFKWATISLQYENGQQQNEIFK